MTPRAFALLAAAALALLPPAASGGTIRGTLSVAKARNLPATLVYLEHVDGEFPAPARHAVMDQKNIEFVPHVLPVVAGTTVDFLNSDPVPHNVFTPDKCVRGANLGTWPRGEVRSLTFREPGCSPVMLCNVHPEMEAFVVVLQNPYYAVPDKAGGYQIQNVPPGTYTVRVWFRKFLKVAKQVVVPHSGEVTCDLDAR